MKMSELGDLQLSKLRYYSVGVVAENKALSSKVIQVTPLEDTGFVDGDVTGKLASSTATGLTASGASYSASVNASAAIDATWLPMNNPNRLTAPDVRRGEMVIIYQFGDQNKFWWSTMKDDHNLRRLETVIYGISAIATEDVPLDANNMYWFEWSSHKKVVHLHTSNANGEPFTYDIQINTGEGAVTITDNIGNIIQLTSKEHRIELKNTDGSHYDMHERNLTVTIPDTTHFKTKDYFIDAENSMKVRAKNLYTLETTDSSFKSSNSTLSEAPATSVIASNSLTVNGGSINVTGSDISVQGSSSVFISSPATTVI